LRAIVGVPTFGKLPSCHATGVSSVVGRWHKGSHDLATGRSEIAHGRAWTERGKWMIYNTEVFEFSDAEKAKEAWMSFRESLEGAGGSDMHVYRNVDNPNQVLATMWWDSAESCRRWAKEHETEAMDKLGSVTRSMEPEFLWQEF
jgi:heme-degrading monooxygenase HmoA